MKKIFSLVFALILIVTCIPVAAVISSPYEKYGDYAWQWDYNDLYCYIGETGVTETNVIIEYDVSASGSNEGLAWSLWTDIDSSVKKELVIDVTEGMAYIGNDYNSSDFDAEASFFVFYSGVDEWNHVKYIFDNGKATININGFDVVSAEGVAAPTDKYFVNIYGGVLTVDNWTISDLEGNVLYYENFEGLADTGFSMGFGSKVKLAIHRGRRFQSEGAYLNGEYYISGLDLGQSQIWEFDLWLEDENSMLSIVADGGDTRYTIGYDFIGVTASGNDSGYSETEIIPTEWSDEGVGLETSGWCRIKIELNVNGKDKIYKDIYVDGHTLEKSFVWTGSAASKEYSDDCLTIDTFDPALGISTGVVIDDLFIKGNKGYGPYEFEDGDKEIFDLAEYSDECEVRWVKVLPEGCLHKCEHIRYQYKEATCTEYGATGWLLCADCTCTLEMSLIVPKLPHEESDWVILEEAGYFNDGLRIKKCVTCGEEIAREVIPADNEDFGLNADNESGLVSGVPSGFTAEEFVSKFEKLGKSVTVTDSEGNTPRYVGTGCVVTFEGEKYTVCVKGDLTGDGVTSAKDIFKVKKHTVGTSELDGIYFDAADINGDGKLNAKDSLALRRAMVNG